MYIFSHWVIPLYAEAVSMGCTKIPVILKNKVFSIPLIDPNDIIAKVAVAYAKNLYDIK